MAASTTLIPFEQFPECVYSCGALYDANGACVPPGLGHTAPAYAYTQCFCMDTRLAGFSTGYTGVCDTACVGTETALESVHEWFTSVCSITAKSTSTTTNSAAPTSTSTKHHKVYDTWIEGHWRWVVAIVVVICLIIGSWIGACIWRRRYLRKKDRMYELGKGIPSRNFVGQDPRDAANIPPSASAAEKKARKWTVRERT